MVSDTQGLLLGMVGHTLHIHSIYSTEIEVEGEYGRYGIVLGDPVESGLFLPPLGMVSDASIKE